MPGDVIPVFIMLNLLLFFDTRPPLRARQVHLANRPQRLVSC
jgi:hypothetical protein